ncbi:hypothetical protein Pmani_013058 [Petrolisthes manimaculis]|uniref:Uncharacterized protein n=1 Tax=Petrolisthes manimaculis TaxID=1843537 RepID=A0AAE1PWQ9_9EUCA|nr:hypothetical protein Pmani_013058 [Petrolisthes manimaculis]
MNVGGFLNLSLFILKLMGGFPFHRISQKPNIITVKSKEAWREDKDSSSSSSSSSSRLKHQTPSNTLNSNYQLSKGWKLWSFFLGAFQLVFVLGTCFVGSQRSYKSVTTNIANFLGDFLSSVIGTVVVMYLMTHTNLAMRIINSLQHQWRRIPETQTINSPSDWLLVLGAVVLTVGMCILPITICLDKDVFEMVKFLDIYEEFLWYAIKLFVIGFLFSVIRFESLVYKNLRTSLVRLLKGQEGSGNSPDESPSSNTESESMTTNDETELREDSTQGKHNNKVDGKVSNLGPMTFTVPPDQNTNTNNNNEDCVLKLGKISSTTNSEDTNTKETEDGDTTNASSPNTIFLSLLKGTRGTLQEVHACHRLLLTYLGFPVTLLLFSCLYDFIINFYYSIIIHPTTSWMSQISDMSFLLLSGVPLLLLPNLPVILQSEQDELKELLQTILHQEETQNMKQEIFSFGATYLVILVQFRLTESSACTEKCSP